MNTHTQKKCAISLQGKKNNNSLAFQSGETHCHQREGCRESYTNEDSKGAASGTEEQEKGQTNASLHRQEHRNRDCRENVFLVTKYQRPAFSFNSRGKKKQ